MHALSFYFRELNFDFWNAHQQHALSHSITWDYFHWPQTRTPPPPPRHPPWSSMRCDPHPQADPSPALRRAKIRQRWDSKNKKTPALLVIHVFVFTAPIHKNIFKCVFVMRERERSCWWRFSKERKEVIEENIESRRKSAKLEHQYCLEWNDEEWEKRKETEEPWHQFFFIS